MANRPFNFSKVVLWILIVGISVPFIWFFTIQSGSIGQSSVMVGKVNGTPIFDGRGTDFSRQYAQLVESYRSRGGDINESIEPRIQMQALNSVALKRLLLSKAKDWKISVDDSDILNLIKQKYFVKEGRFQEQAYRAFQFRGKDSDKQLIEDEAREEVILNALTGSLYSFLPLTTSELYDRIAVRHIQKRAKLATISVDAIALAAISDTEIKAFYESQKAGYAGKNFDEIKTKVKEDFVAAQGQLLKTRARAALSQKLNATIQSGAFQKNFDEAARASGMKVTITAPFHFYSEELRDDNDRPLSDANGTGLIQNIILLHPGQITDLLDEGSSLTIAMVVDEKDTGNASDAADESSFLRRKVQNEMRQDKLTAAYQSFEQSTFRKAKIESFLKTGLASR